MKSVGVLIVLRISQINTDLLFLLYFQKLNWKKNKKKGKPLHNTDIYTNFAKNKLAGFKSKAKNKNHKYQKNDKER